MTNTLIDQALETARQEQVALFTLWDDKVYARDISTRLVAGRFNRLMVETENLGYLSQKHRARIVYGDFTPFGNIEGSLYLLFGAPIEQQLRVRWAGAGPTSIVLAGTRLIVTSVKLHPRTVNNHEIKEITDNTVLIYPTHEHDATELPVEELLSAIVQITRALRLTRTVLTEAIESEENMRV